MKSNMKRTSRIPREEDEARGDFEDGFRIARRTSHGRLMAAKAAQADAYERLVRAEAASVAADAAASAAAREYGGVLRRFGAAVAVLASDG